IKTDNLSSISNIQQTSLQPGSSSKQSQQFQTFPQQYSHVPTILESQQYQFINPYFRPISTQHNLIPPPIIHNISYNNPLMNQTIQHQVQRFPPPHYNKPLPKQNTNNNNNNVVLALTNTLPQQFKKQ
ncbi:hypothetical protein Mgra_00002882, partial [Meloidogyne graminicola]